MKELKVPVIKVRLKMIECSTTHFERYDGHGVVNNDNNVVLGDRYAVVCSVLC